LYKTIIIIMVMIINLDAVEYLKTILM